MADDSPAAALFVGMLVRHAVFAPVRVVAAVPNPFPRVRRSGDPEQEPPGTVHGGIILTTNAPALEAMLVAIGRGVGSVAGAALIHVWPDAPDNPGHFCHLGGLVLVPEMLVDVAEAPLYRALLRRRCYERTGHAGPSDEVPPPSGLMPADWPERLRPDPDVEDASIGRLREILSAPAGNGPSMRSTVGAGPRPAAASSKGAEGASTKPRGRRTALPTSALVAASVPDRWDLDAEFLRDLSSHARTDDLRILAGLVARFSLWIVPRLASSVPVVFPKTARVHGPHQRAGDIVDGIRPWHNEPAEEAFFTAIGSSRRAWRNVAVCHVYPDSAIDPDHFTRLANLVGLPAALRRFARWKKIAEILRYRAYDEWPRAPWPSGQG